MHLSYNYQWHNLLNYGQLSNGNGSAVHVVGRGNSSTALLCLAAASGVSTVTIQESEDGVNGWTDCVKTGKTADDSDGDAAITHSATDDNKTLTVDFYRTKPYLRAVTSGVTGTNNAILVVGVQKQVVARPGEAAATQLLHSYPQ
jgi:hypothetical protein